MTQSVPESLNMTVLVNGKVTESANYDLAYVLYKVLELSQAVDRVEFKKSLAIYGRDGTVIRIASLDRETLEKLYSAHRDSTGDVAYDWMRFFGVSHGTAFYFRNLPKSTLLLVQSLAQGIGCPLESVLMTHKLLLR